MKDYVTKKKAVIAVLSLICLCLAGGLIYYLGYIDHSPAPPAMAKDTDAATPEVTAPPITVPANDASTQDSSTGGQSTSADTTAQDNTPDGEKPKTPGEATPPAPPKVTDEKALTDPSKPPEYTPEQTKPGTKASTPKGGEKKDGKIYVPGFGWVEDKGGGVKVETAPNAGTGEPVGDM